MSRFLQFDNVVFSYPGMAEPLLGGVTMSQKTFLYKFYCICLSIGCGTFWGPSATRGLSPKSEA
jgi:hypothetical protein